MKDADTIERMGTPAGRRAGPAAGRQPVAPGVTTDELDRIGHEFLLDQGAYPLTLGYRGFPKSLCTSVNEVVCHGPAPTAGSLEDGDLHENIDITAYLDGIHGDTNATSCCPSDVDEESRLLVERARGSVAPGE